MTIEELRNHEIIIAVSLCFMGEEKMGSHRLLVIGFGNVGQGLAQILRDHGAELARQVCFFFLFSPTFVLHFSIN